MTAVYDPEQLDKKERADIENPDPKDNQAADDSSDPRELGAKEKETEAPQHENQVGDGYKSNDSLANDWGKGNHKPSSFRSVGQFFVRNRKNTIIGGVVAAFIAITVFVFLAVLPLKIMHIVQDLQNRFFASSENASQKETDKLFSYYIKTTISKCGRKGPISKDCNPFTSGTLVQNLFRGWRQARLEEDLASKGLEFRRDRNDGTWHLKIPEMNDGGVSLEKGFLDSNNPDLDNFIKTSPEFERYSSRYEFRNGVLNRMNKALEGQTRYKKTMYRIKVTRLLKQKYGIKLCVIACKFIPGADRAKQLKESFGDWKTSKKQAYKLFLTQRVLNPREELTGLILECILNPQCTYDKVVAAKPGEYNADKSGCKDGCRNNAEPESEEDRLMRAKLETLAAGFATDKLALDKLWSRYEKNGFSAYLLDKFLPKKITELLTGLGDKKAGAAAKKLKDKLPLIGAVLFADSLFTVADKLPTILQKLSYDANAASEAQIFTLFRTHNDEYKEGDIDAEMFGSFVTALGPGQQIDEGTGDQTGGDAEAEHTPMYQAIFGGGNTTVASLPKLLSSSAYAASTDSTKTTYTCEDNKPVPTGELACKDMKLGKSLNGWFVTYMQNLKKTPFWQALKWAHNSGIGTLNNLISAIFSKVGLAVCWVLGPLCNAFSALLGWLASAAQPLLKPIENFILGILGVDIKMVNNRMSGGRTSDLMIGGADVTGNEFAHAGLGGVKLTGSQVEGNLTYFYNQQYDQFHHQSFIARLFDSESPYSLRSKLAMALPLAPKVAVVKSFASFLSNPFGGIQHSFFSSFGQHAAAAVPRAWGSESDPFEVTQYGYPLNDPIFQQDPDAYWTKYCTGPNSLTNKWNQYAADQVSKDTNYLPENNAHNFGPASPTGTNGCLLIQSAVGSAGALYTEDVLTPDEKADGY